jgi:hypothetical protein
LFAQQQAAGSEDEDEDEELSESGSEHEQSGSGSGDEEDGSLQDDSGSDDEPGESDDDQEEGEEQTRAERVRSGAAAGTSHGDGLADIGCPVVHTGDALEAANVVRKHYRIKVGGQCVHVGSRHTPTAHPQHATGRAMVLHQRPPACPTDHSVVA